MLEKKERKEKKEGTGREGGRQEEERLGSPNTQRSSGVDICILAFPGVKKEGRKTYMNEVVSVLSLSSGLSHSLWLHLFCSARKHL